MNIIILTLLCMSWLGLALSFPLPNCTMPEILISQPALRTCDWRQIDKIPRRIPGRATAENIEGISPKLMAPGKEDSKKS
jgi:hypothetical protein